MTFFNALRLLGFHWNAHSSRRYNNNGGDDPIATMHTRHLDGPAMSGKGLAAKPEVIRSWSWLTKSSEQSSGGCG
ncbi:hypothetical protein, partial [Xanthomonas prunicola]|uniref:hypothetical protein n=1 Tax=Xanthomonas prunicola TaxID=2053930 RepID=UPI001A9C33D6